MRPWLVSFTCCLHLFTQKRTYPVESSVSTLQLLTLDSRCCIPLHNCLYLKLLTLDSSLDLIWAAQQHFVRFQQVLAWTTDSLVNSATLLVCCNVTTIMISINDPCASIYTTATITNGQQWHHTTAMDSIGACNQPICRLQCNYDCNTEFFNLAPVWNWPL